MCVWSKVALKGWGFPRSNYSAVGFPRSLHCLVATRGEVVVALGGNPYCSMNALAAELSSSAEALLMQQITFHPERRARTCGDSLSSRLGART